MIEFLNKYFIYIWLILVIVMMSFLFIKGKILMIPFLKVKNENVLFSQRFTSAISLNPKKKNRGGAGKVLHIIITENNLVLKTGLLFTFILNQVDLLHIIPLKNILETRIEKRTFFPRLYVKYRKENGSTNEIAIMSSKNEIIRKLINENAYNSASSVSPDPTSKQQ